MKIKVTESKEAEELKFPCLMQYKDTVILAAAGSENYLTGFVIESNNRDLGEYCSSWNRKLFSTFHGTITLSND